MSQRRINLWAGELGDSEDLENRANTDANFTDLFPAGNYADELSAARAGVVKGQTYHTNGTMKVFYNDVCIPGAGALALSGKLVTRS